MLMYKNYLFDLDGTLLPMDMEKIRKAVFFIALQAVHSCYKNRTRRPYKGDVGRY